MFGMGFWQAWGVIFLGLLLSFWSTVQEGLETSRGRRIGVGVWIALFGSAIWVARQ